MSRLIKLPNQQGLNSTNRLLWDKYALTYIWQVSAERIFSRLDWLWLSINLFCSWLLARISLQFNPQIKEHNYKQNSFLIQIPKQTIKVVWRATTWNRQKVGCGCESSFSIMNSACAISVARYVLSKLL